MSLSSDAPLPPPIPNSYWVQPGRLLAGEYPGSVSRADAMERIRRLLRAGITSFIDLTEEGELPPYDHLLPDLTEQAVRYRRLPIVDHGLPETPEHMARILDCVEGELAAGRNVYVHCHAGIGRTGTTMGCLLIRGGLASDAALEHLQSLWQQCGRARHWPTVPETREQIEFVRSWQELSSGGRRTASAQRAEGALIGLAIGDAIGTLIAGGRFDAGLAAASRDPGASTTSPLVTGAHTAMTRAVAESLHAVGAHDPEDQMRRYLQWTRDIGGVGVPPELKRALGVWQWSRKPNAGTHDPRNLDAHTLARSLAVALFVRGDAAAAIAIAAEVSRTTQQAPIVLDLCRFWVALYVDALADCERSELVALHGPALQLVRERALKQPVRNLIEHRGAARQASAALVNDDALSVTHAALSAFAQTGSFRDAVIHVAASMRAPPAAAALCGALAGAHYGSDAIPPEWRGRLGEDAVLRSLARQLSG